MLGGGPVLLLPPLRSQEDGVQVSDKDDYNDDGDDNAMVMMMTMMMVMMTMLLPSV